MLNDLDLRRISTALFGMMLIGCCMILRMLITRKREVDHHLKELGHRVQALGMQIHVLMPELKQATRKLAELEESFHEDPGMSGEDPESLMAPVAEMPDRSGEAPAEFEEYRKDLWKLAENRVTLEDHVNKWHGRKVKPRHDPTVKATGEVSVVGDTLKGCRFRVGQWVRHTSGILERVTKIKPQHNEPGRFWLRTENHFSSDSATDGEDLFPAVPMKGEWWKKISCPKAEGGFGHPISWDPIPFQIGDRVPYDVEGLVRCGCVVPQNYGKSKTVSGL